MGYENQHCELGWIGDDCILQSWGFIGVLPEVLRDFFEFVSNFIAHI